MHSTRKIKDRRFEHYSDALRCEFTQVLGPGGCEMLERNGRFYADIEDVACWLSTPKARAKDISKAIADLAFVRKRFIDSGLVATAGQGLFPRTTLKDHVREQRAKVERLKQA